MDFWSKTALSRYVILLTLGCEIAEIILFNEWFEHYIAWKIDQIHQFKQRASKTLFRIT